MKKLRPTYTSRQATTIHNTSDPPASLAFRVGTFSELVREVAVLSNVNFSQMLFFRGQVVDHQNKEGKTTLYPTIYRGDPLQRAEVSARFEVLESAADQLVAVLALSLSHNKEDLRRRKFGCWAILQHYHVCLTPFLDITQSLHVACSFATHNNTNDYGYVYILGLPYSSSRIAMDAEDELVNVRLLSISPPEALRPHFQEGYVTATLDVTNDYDEKNELDFNRRLIMKFQIPVARSFWGNGFGPIPWSQLFPDAYDEVLSAVQALREFSQRMARPGDIGRFVGMWARLEHALRLRATGTQEYRVQLGRAIQDLVEKGRMERSLANRIENLRTFRNRLVHRTTEVDTPELVSELDRLSELMKRLDVPIE